MGAVACLLRGDRPTMLLVAFLRSHLLPVGSRKLPHCRLRLLGSHTLAWSLARSENLAKLVAIFYSASTMGEGWRLRRWWTVLVNVLAFTRRHHPAIRMLYNRQCCSQRC